MEAGELTHRVLRAGVLAVGAVAVGAAVLFGLGEGAGVAAGGGIAFGSFRWLARDAARLVAPDGPAPARRLLGIGLRQMAALAGLTALIASGWSHPVAVAAGLALLPPVLVIQGLRAAAATPGRP
jgi:ATP synthase I chain